MAGMAGARVGVGGQAAIGRGDSMDVLGGNRILAEENLLPTIASAA
jgi:hypothetical protein